MKYVFWKQSLGKPEKALLSRTGKLHCQRGARASWERGLTPCWEGAYGWLQAQAQCRGWGVGGAEGPGPSTALWDCNTTGKR